NADAYHKFAVQIAKEKRIHQQKVKEIYRQRRLGDWGTTEENSLSKNLSEKNTQYSSAIEAQTTATINIGDNSQKSDRKTPAESTSDNRKDSGESEVDDGLEFAIDADVVVDGRLQVQAEDVGTHQLLKPWQAKPDADLPENTLIEISDIRKVPLPQYVLNHSHHPLGALALVEAVLLCHQHRPLSTIATYNLNDIWNDGLSFETDTIKHEQILPHAIDTKLMTVVTSLDRRLDSALIEIALSQLRQKDLSELFIENLKLKSKDDHSHDSHQYYKKQERCRTMLLRYQQGIFELFNQHLTSDLTKSLANDSSDQNISSDNSHATALNNSSVLAHQKSPILSLWQALHLQQLLPILFEVLQDTDAQDLWPQILKTGIEDVRAQLDPSGQVFTGLDTADVSVIVLLAYRLSKDVKGQMISMHDRSLLSECNDSVAHYIVDLRRHARLIDIDLMTVSDLNLQWLLLTAQHLNSIQLLAIISAVPVSAKHSTKRLVDAQNADNYREKQQDGSQIDYNESEINQPTHNEYRQWLSTLHTVMLHDTIISQDEYDCLLVMSERWFGIRQLF
ncbi:MAG: M48 family metalloprotease, partial [Psychrobacter sp.]